MSPRPLPGRDRGRRPRLPPFAVAAWSRRAGSAAAVAAVGGGARPEVRHSTLAVAMTSELAARGTGKAFCNGEDMWTVPGWFQCDGGKILRFFGEKLSWDSKEKTRS